MGMATSTRQEAEVPKGLRKRVFPPKTGKKRERGAPKPGISFRSPEDVVAWLAKMELAGHDRTEVIVTALRVGRDVAERIGDRWYEIEYRARRKGIEPGGMLAELALAAIEAEQSSVHQPKTKK